MELAGRYISPFNTDLMSLQPVVDEDFPLTPFVTQGQIMSQRPYRIPDLRTFLSPGPKGPGF
jgi:hypothetical protein